MANELYGINDNYVINNIHEQKKIISGEDGGIFRDSGIHVRI